jgi:hypothetical protein
MSTETKKPTPAEMATALESMAMLANAMVKHASDIAQLAA